MNGFANEAFAAATERAASKMQELAIALETGAAGGLSGAMVLTESPNLRDTVRDSLRPEFADDVCPFEKTFKLPHWTVGKLGGVDVLVRGPSSDTYRYMAELKWARETKELGWTLWDLYKMVSATFRRDTEACYLVVGAPQATWQSGKHFSAAFSTNLWDSQQLFIDYEADWRRLLKGGTARPTKVPSRVATTLVADAAIVTPTDKWSLRCLAVGPASTDWLMFDGNWPMGQPR